MAELMTKIWNLNFPSPSCKFVALAIARSSRRNGSCWASQKYLGQVTGYSRKTISAQITALEELGWLKRLRRKRKNGGNTTDRIWLTLPEIILPAEKIDADPGRSIYPSVHEAKTYHVVEPGSVKGRPPCREDVAPGNQRPRGGEAKAQQYVVPDLVDELVPQPEDPAPDGASHGGTKIDSKTESTSKSESYDQSVEIAFNEYNEMARCAGLPEALSLPPGRRKLLEERLASFGLEAWRHALRIVETSNFCRGLENFDQDRQWKADLGFLLIERNYIRLLEGSYGGEPFEPDGEGRDLRQISEAQRLLGAFEKPTDFAQRQWMEHLQQGLSWDPKWGPRPGYPGCRVREDLQKEFGFAPWRSEENYGDASSESYDKDDCPEALA